MSGEMTPPGGCAAKTLAPQQAPQQAPPQAFQAAKGWERSQGDQDAPVSLGVTESAQPILHFSSGGSSPERRRLLRAVNDERNYAAAEKMLNEMATPLTVFQNRSLRWILAALKRSTGAAIEKNKARLYQASSAQRAAYVENVAFELIMQGKPNEAKETCGEALRAYPTSQGIWINLLVAMKLLNQRESIEQVLLKLPNVVNVDEGLLGVYLVNAPELQRPVCNGG